MLVPDQRANAANDLRTSVRLIADASSVTPGSMFTVGVVLTMQQGWHTYWENPGEAGIPTTIEWRTPPGFVTGGILWPVPHKYVEAGDVLTYGYAGETMLLVPVTVPPDASPGSLATLTAKVAWLECEHTCVPGETEVSLTIAIAALPGKIANEAVFARYRNELPIPSGPDGPVRLTTRLVAGAAEIRIAPAEAMAKGTAVPGAPDFYPVPAGELQVGRTTARADGDTVVLTVSLPRGVAATSPVPLRGVLLYTLASGERRREAVNIPIASSGGASILDLDFRDSTMETSSRPLALYFVFAIVGGLLLNIMPCVLPVVALKIFGLVKMAGDRPERITRLGWAFSAGILFSFLVLALLVVLLQLAGEQVGWGFQFQEPLFVIAMAAIVFAFGLSLFGVYEIQVPGAAVNGISAALAQNERRGAGYGASFAEGVFATILATPCTAPFLGSALGFAFSQTWWVIIGIFSSVAFGMSLPYLILTARPAWLKYLPKPGAWMETAKQFMGFLMMATLLWLLYILGKQLGVEAVIWTGAFLLSVGVGCWIVGRFATLVASRGAYRLAWIVALVVVVGGYFLFLESALNVRGVIAGIATAGPAAEGERGGIRWKPFTLAGLQEDLRGEYPVFVDFTAEWCLTCKVNEKTVFGARQVVEAFEKSHAIAVRADWTSRNPDITRLLARFGRSGVPLYVVFPPGKADAPIILPEVITPGMVIEALSPAFRGAPAVP